MNPLTFDDFFLQGRSFAEYSLRHADSLRPTFFLYGEHPIMDPPSKDSRFIQMHVLATDMDTPAQKNRVAELARLLNLANGATHCCLVIECWMSHMENFQPREAPDRQEYVVMLAESFTGKAQQFLPIIRSDNGKFFGLGNNRADAEKITLHSGRFVDLLPPKIAPPEIRELAKVGLTLSGVHMHQCGVKEKGQPFPPYSVKAK